MAASAGTGKGFDLTAGQGDGFRVYISGRVESGQFLDVESLTCMYDFTHGADWTLEQGSESGETQRSRNVRGHMDDASAAWNFPIDLVYHSTNVHGWPRVVLTCRDDRRVLVGYGTCHIPCSAGTYTRYARVFAPTESSPIQRLVAWLTGEPAEYFNPRLPASNFGREVTRTKSHGVVKLQITVSTSGMERHGYSESKGHQNNRSHDNVGKC
jgi:B9 domain-containing protein 1